MIERLGSPLEKEGENFNHLRPLTLESFIGQKILKENLSVFIQAALKRGEPLDHCLFSGPPGLGKTTLSYIVAREMRANIKTTSAPVIEKTGDMAGLLTSLEKGDVLFIDEIHRLRPIVEEILYSAMEDFVVDINLGQGVTAKTVKINVAPFTLVGATTRPGGLTQPLLSRFGIIGQFEFYDEKELLEIISANAKKMGVVVEEEAMLEIARRSRFTPRILNRLVKRVRDFAEVAGEEVVSVKSTKRALEKMGIDSLGLDGLDRRYLEALSVNFKGGPVGLDNIATSLSEDASTLEDIIEPFLIKLGFIRRLPRGRVATLECFKYLGVQGKGSEENPSLLDL